jgi:AcrR family transcriptional regulator
MLTMSTSKKRPSLKSGYHHGNLLADLKMHAIKLIETNGVNHLSLRDLAAKCGASATAVYRHYENKEHLLAAIAQEGFNELQQAMLKANHPNKLQEIGIAYINFALQHPVKFKLMFGTFLEKHKYPALHDASNKAYQILRSQVEEGFRQGLMIGDIDSSTRTAWAAVHGAAMLLLDGQFAIQKNEIIDSNKIAIEITTVLGRGLFIQPK